MAHSSWLSVFQPTAGSSPTVTSTAPSPPSSKKKYVKSRLSLGSPCLSPFHGVLGVMGSGPRGNRSGIQDIWLLFRPNHRPWEHIESIWLSQQSKRSYLFQTQQPAQTYASIWKQLEVKQSSFFFFFLKEEGGNNTGL